MEELKIGEFIRTKSGEIYEIDYVGESVVISGEEIVIPLNYIENHSFEIIDLVKIGDYVNGEKVTDTWNGNRIETHRSNFHEEDIKSIVTKEKFSSVEFIVEE